MKKVGTKRIAERYVKALFDVANATASVDAVEADLTHLGAAISASSELASFLDNPLLDNALRAQGMLAVLDRMKASQLTRQFLGMVLQQKRLALLPVMIEEFLRVASAARGELAAEVISAAPLNDKEIATLNTRLSRAYGRTMRLSVRHDASLLGGMVLKIGSQQLDSSMAGKIRRLSQALKAA